jgi:hypothetical protein
VGEWNQFKNIPLPHSLAERKIDISKCIFKELWYLTNLKILTIFFFRKTNLLCSLWGGIFGNNLNFQKSHPREFG